MTDRANPVETFTDVPWLPPGSHAEVWLGNVAAPEGMSTSAFALPFDDQGRLLLTNVRKRGLDIPGGHIEAGESAEATAMRETPEETGATIRILGKVGHLRLVVPNPPPGYRYPTESYQPFYAAVIESRGPVRMPEECDEPVLTDPNEAADDPRFRMHRAFILAAADLVRDLGPSTPVLTR